MPLDIDPTVDYVFKKLFADPANKDLLIDLLNAVLQPPRIVDVNILSPFNAKDFCDDKLSIVDIKARGDDGTWYNVEIQNRLEPSFPRRLAYYSSKLYGTQLLEGDEYSQLMPAITICFLTEILFAGHSVPHLRFTLSDLAQGMQLTDQIQIHTIELAKYNFSGVTLASAEALAQWAFFLSHAAEFEAEALKRLLPKRELVKATGVVEMIAHTPEERYQYEARLKAERDNRSRMKELQADAMAKGLEQGRELGLEQGREQGLKQGLAGQVQLLQSVLKEPVSELECLLKLPAEDLNSLIAELKARLQLKS